MGEWLITCVVPRTGRLRRTSASRRCSRRRRRWCTNGAWGLQALLAEGWSTITAPFSRSTWRTRAHPHMRSYVARQQPSHLHADEAPSAATCDPLRRAPILVNPSIAAVLYGDVRADLRYDVRFGDSTHLYQCTSDIIWRRSFVKSARMCSHLKDVSAKPITGISANMIGRIKNAFIEERGKPEGSVPSPSSRLGVKA